MAARKLRRALQTQMLERRDAPAVFRVGGEFLVNTHTTSFQLNGAVAMDGQGNFVTVWQSFSQDGDNYGIYAQRYSANGTKLGGETLVNTTTTGGQVNPAIAMDGDGDYVVTWQSFDVSSNYDIYFQRFNSAGAPVGVETRANLLVTSGLQTNPSVAVADDGRYVIAWQDAIPTDPNFNVVYQRFNADGTFRGPAATANLFTTGNQTNPSVAMNATGQFVLAWSSDIQDSGTFGVYARVFNDNGVPATGELPVNSATTSAQHFASVGMDSDGDFIVAYQSVEFDPNSYDVFARRFSAAGVPAGTEFRVNTTTSTLQIQPALAMNPDGDYVVLWQSTLQDGDGWGVFGQRYAANDAKDGGEFQVNTRTTNIQLKPSVALNAQGDFVGIWQSFKQDTTDSYGVYAQRYAQPSTVQTVQVNDGTAQRSRVTSLTVTFSEAVTFSPNAASAFTVVGKSGPIALSVDTVTLSTPNQTVAVITFSGAGTTAGSLDDSNYTLTVLDGTVTNSRGQSLDGDANGSPGGASATNFYRLFGDANGDRKVDSTDFIAFRGTFNLSVGNPGYLAYFDSNGDNKVDSSDFIQFRGRFNTNLPA